MPKVTKGNKIDDIIKGKWTPKQIQAMIELAEPKREKDEIIAKRVGLSRKQLWVWKNLPGFMENVIAIADELFLEWDLQVSRAVLKEALMGNIPAANLWMKLRGKLVEKMEHAGPEGKEIVFRWEGKKEEENGD